MKILSNGLNLQTQTRDQNHFKWFTEPKECAMVGWGCPEWHKAGGDKTYALGP